MIRRGLLSTVPPTDSCVLEYREVTMPFRTSRIMKGITVRAYRNVLEGRYWDEIDEILCVSSRQTHRVSCHHRDHHARVNTGRLGN